VRGVKKRAARKIEKGGMCGTHKRVYARGEVARRGESEREREKGGVEGGN